MKWRNCPHCDARVHWTRYYLKAHVWARWPCGGCGALITFDPWRRLLMGLGAAFSAVLGIALFVVVHLTLGLTAAILSTGTLIGVSCLWFLIDGVRAVTPDPGPLCPKCRYPILPTVASGVLACPECGTTIPARIASHPRVADLTSDRPSTRSATTCGPHDEPDGNRLREKNHP